MQPESLTRGGKLEPAAIDAAPADAGALKKLITGSDATLSAAGAIIAGSKTVSGLTAELAAQLPREGLPGRAAAWALGHLGGERELLAAVESGGIDQRDNAYAGLAVLAATGKASTGLGVVMRARVAAEVAKAKAGGTGLGEHAVRVLAVLGDAEAGAQAQAVLDGDRFCDRFELQRIKKAVLDGRKDSDAVRQFSATWGEFFADHVFVPEAPKPAAKQPAPPMAANAEAELDEPPLDADAAALPPTAGVPVDWKAFAASPEATALPAQLRQMAVQLGQMLEQLAVRAVQAALADLSRDEFAAVLLQVLPQALPPQHVQAALSPQAINGYQALVKFLIRTGVATQGDGLLQGVKLVRQMMAEQLKRSGILGGPDYSDPDEKKPIL
mgnify:CR=1 FL=1